MIYSYHPISVNVLKEAIAEILPAYSIFEWNYIDDAPAAYRHEDNLHLVVYQDFDPDKIEFPHCLTIDRLPDATEQDLLLRIGLSIALRLKFEVLVAIMHPKFPHNPYYDVLFKDGKCFLVDDCDSNFADGTEGRIKILGELRLENGLPVF